MIRHDQQQPLFDSSHPPPSVLPNDDFLFFHRIRGDVCARESKQTTRETTTSFALRIYCIGVAAANFWTELRITKMIPLKHVQEPGDCVRVRVRVRVCVSMWYGCANMAASFYLFTYLRRTKRGRISGRMICSKRASERASGWVCVALDESRSRGRGTRAEAERRGEERRGEDNTSGGK